MIPIVSCNYYFLVGELFEIYSRSENILKSNFFCDNRRKEHRIEAPGSNLVLSLIGSVKRPII